MNPDPFALAYWGSRRDHERRIREARQRELHNRAMTKRRKRKNGGPK